MLTKVHQFDCPRSCNSRAELSVDNITDLGNQFVLTVITLVMQQTLISQYQLGFFKHEKQFLFGSLIILDGVAKIDK